jgi:phycocyanobilin:ferredoxin oxidoreductase
MINQLAEIIRESWKDLPDLSPLSVNPKFEKVYKDVDDEKLSIHNEVYQCRGLRKIHLEVAKLGMLDILHCIWYPDPKYNLPIFGADIVANKSFVSAAITDLSPVDGLTPMFDKICKISDKYKFEKERDMPGWGNIFSPYVKFMSLDTEEEKNNFCFLVKEYLDVFSDEVRISEENIDRERIRFDGQINYCKQQKKNDKTRRILIKCFDEEWADQYINEILFDEPI